MYYLHPHILIDKSGSSVCTSWVLVTLQPWIAGHCYDDLLDVLWRVSTLFLLEDSNAQTPTFRVGGYFSSRVYASLGGTDRRKNAFLTATALPT